MPAYRRQQPLSERISAALNIYDWLLWLSEEIESYGWDQVEKTWALPIGFISNLIFIIARSNTGMKSRSYNDVFGESSGPGWAVAIANFFTYLLTIICVLNTAYTFARKRSYRLFEASVDKVPNTPSAHRVKVHSAPMSSSPLRYISSILGGETAASRAHPNPQEDVWEVMLWDPLPVSLKLFCYFSPGHVILYWLFLPTLPADPRPSVTVVTALLLAGVLSLQLTWMSSCFSQQGKDTALISKEVMNEYDVKFVRPRTTPLYRDVGIQFSEDESYSTARDMKYNEVVVFPPAFVINRGFKTNPNPNYTDQADQGDPVRHSNYQNAGTPADIRSPVMRNDFSSPLKPQTAIRQPVFRPTAAGGGSLGVYSHAASPLRKSASTNFTPGRNRDSMSPEKRRSVPGGGLVNTNAASQRWSHLKNDPSRRGTGNF